MRRLPTAIALSTSFGASARSSGCTELSPAFLTSRCQRIPVIYQNPKGRKAFSSTTLQMWLTSSD
jgi:hypothetical protein